MKGVRHQGQPGAERQGTGVRGATGWVVKTTEGQNSRQRQGQRPRGTGRECTKRQERVGEVDGWGMQNSWVKHTVGCGMWKPLTHHGSNAFLDK